ncbi:MAG: hypothetical protein HZY75_05625 [Nocardioidaceae bacterium]|nr:MAG: hypothetical protein HZY75_05625 [Nocardioidaceae bacterium]
MQKANFETGYELVEFGRIVKRVVKLDSVEATLVRFGVGASVEEDAVAPGLLGEFNACPLPHVAYIIEGAIRIRQTDGSEDVFRAGDIMMLPPHHDAWTVGDEDCLFVEFSRGSVDYYGAPELAH